MQPLQLLVLVCLGAFGSSQPRQVEISAGYFTKAMSMLSSILTSMMSTSSASPAEPLIDGVAAAGMRMPGAGPASGKISSATGYLCFDPRTELEKIPNRREAADHKNGRCLYSHESNMRCCVWKDKDKGVRGEGQTEVVCERRSNRRNIWRNTRNFGPLLLLLLLLQQWAEEEAGDGHRRHGRSAYRGRESGTLETQ